MSNEMKDWLADKILETKQLVDMFPWLHPVDVEGKRDENYCYDWCWVDDLPQGWAKSFVADFLTELNEAMTPEEREEYYILQVKEKYGMMRWYGNFETEAMSKVLHKYEDMSEKTCIYCGEPSTTLTTNGWIVPVCEKCVKKYGFKNNNT